MKLVNVFVATTTVVASVATAFQSMHLEQPRTGTTTGSLFATVERTTNDEVVDSNRQYLVKNFPVVAGAGLMVGSSLTFDPGMAHARGRATLQQSYDRYAPRIRAGGEFYGGELRAMVQKDDWEGIKAALQEPPKRQKSDLNKPDAGVAERARQSGQFSDARVLVAADLYAAGFSDNSISEKTKKMQAAVVNLRAVVKEMESVAKQALGEESSGGFFGLGAKKPSKAELSKRMRELYVEGGNAWNEYIFAANENVALQFDKFNYIK